MQVDLTKILSVSGQRGLFLLIGQSRNGVIVEALGSKKRTLFDMKSRITSLADISIYTQEEELKLQQVFENIKTELNGQSVMSSKEDEAQIKSFFAKIVPNYDADRFYLSHMKKILDWFGELQRADYLEFITEEQS